MLPGWRYTACDSASIVGGKKLAAEAVLPGHLAAAHTKPTPPPRGGVVDDGFPEPATAGKGTGVPAGGWDVMHIDAAGWPSDAARRRVLGPAIDECFAGCGVKANIAGGLAFELAVVIDCRLMQTGRRVSRRQRAPQPRGGSPGQSIGQDPGRVAGTQLPNSSASSCRTRASL